MVAVRVRESMLDDDDDDNRTRCDTVKAVNPTAGDIRILFNAKSTCITTIIVIFDEANCFIGTFVERW